MLMGSNSLFSALGDWEVTRDSLHWYIKAMAAIPRAHALPHPRWWHISLKVQPDGLITDTMHAPDGGTFYSKMDLREHVVRLITSWESERVFSLTAGLTATQLGHQLIDALAESGLSAEYALDKFANDDPRLYAPDQASRYFTVLERVDRVFKRHRATLEGEVGPVQLWPHGFDLAFEWFGTRSMVSKADGEVQLFPAQLNLGFSPGDASYPQPYFFSNPWPFEAEYLLDKSLPAGARWFTGSWQGSLLPFSELVGDPTAEERLLEYAQTVFEISAPTLSAEWEQPSSGKAPHDE